MYPRYLVTNKDNIYGPDYQAGENKFKIVDLRLYCLEGTEDTSIADFELSEPLMYIDQVPHTYGYTMGAYAIQVYPSNFN